MRIGIFVVLSALASGCSGGGGGAPAESLVAQEMAVLATNISEGRLAISEIAKTDGMLLPDGRYAMDVSAKASIPIPACTVSKWRTGGSREHQREGFHMMGMAVDKPQTSRKGCANDGLRGNYDIYGYLYMGSGFSETFPGRAIVVKKESGWHVVDAWLYVKK